MIIIPGVSSFANTKTSGNSQQMGLQGEWVLLGGGFINI